MDFNCITASSFKISIVLLGPVVPIPMFPSPLTKNKLVPLLYVKLLVLTCNTSASAPSLIVDITTPSVSTTLFPLCNHTAGTPAGDDVLSPITVNL